MESLVIVSGALAVLALLLVGLTAIRGRDAAARLKAEAQLAEAERRLAGLAVERDAAVQARILAERAAATAQQKLADGEARLGDFERLKEASLRAAQAAVLTTAQQLSSKLIEDHKRENAEARKEGEARVREASQQLVKQVGDLATAVAQLHGQVSEKSQILDTVWRALSSPGGAGQFAEVGLANTLRSFGLEPERDFVLQHTTQDEETGRRLRPDAVVFLPGDSLLVIDCKASKFLLEIARTEGTPEEAAAYQSFGRTMNTHLKALAEKDYRGAILAAFRQSGRGDTPSRLLSVMYLPNESALDKLNRADPDFILKAQRYGIIPAGPAGLHCAISLASVEIKRERQLRNQQEIAETTRLLLDGLVVVLGHAATLGKGLKSAAEGFARLSASINGRLLPRARKLGQLGLQPGKPLPGNIASYTVASHEGDLIEGEAAELEARELARPAAAQLAK